MGKSSGTTRSSSSGNPRGLTENEGTLRGGIILDTSAPDFRQREKAVHDEANRILEEFAKSHGGQYSITDTILNVEFGRAAFDVQEDGVIKRIHIGFSTTESEGENISLNWSVGFHMTGPGAYEARSDAMTLRTQMLEYKTLGEAYRDATKKVNEFNRKHR